MSKCSNDKERKEVCNHNCTTFSNKILRERLIPEKKNDGKGEGEGGSLETESGQFPSKLFCSAGRSDLKGLENINIVFDLKMCENP